MTGSFRSPLSLRSRSPYSRRIGYYLGRFLSVIDATICVSERPSEMTNVAISVARKLYVSMYLDPSLRSSVPLLFYSFQRGAAPASTNIFPPKQRRNSGFAKVSRRSQQRVASVSRRKLPEGLKVATRGAFRKRVEFRCLSRTRPLRDISIHEHFITLKRPMRNIVGFRLDAILR